MESSFSESRSERSRKAFLRVLPPRRHIVAIMTGGLKRLYCRIRENEEISHNEVGKFTDKLGRFQPPEGLMLASRYHVLSILPSWGQSAMLVRAQDVVRDNMMVMIKALHSSQLYFEIGFQEAHMLRRLACADPHGFSHTVRLLNVFLYDHHFCLVFELLDPRPITHVLASLNLSHKEKLKVLRKVTLQLLQVIGFLQQNNTIHADLKPENILLNDVHDASSLRVIDFGNAINHVHREMSLYYRDFQVQTLLYRAPEVVFGMPFGAEIDMWSVGCILAEIYLGKPLIFGTDRITLVQSMVDVLGPLPHRLFQRGKYFEHLESFATKDSSQSDVTSRLMARFQQRTQLDFTFANLLSGLLCYDPDKRLTPAQAAQHPFLAPEVCLSYLRSDSGSQQETISTVFLSQENYKNRPQIAVEICRQGPSSTDLLRMGTNKDCKNSPKHVSSLVPPSESHRCAASHLHESSCQLQTKSQHSSSGEHRDMCLNIASVSMCARLSMSDRESQTCEATAQDLHESRTTCTHLQDRGNPGEVSRTSQARESAVVLCQSPDTTCVMETSQVVTHNDDQRHLRCCVLYNKSPETDVEGFHCAQQCSQNNICRTVEPQVSTSSKRVHGKLQKIHITSLNKSLAVSRHEATQARALAADSSAKGFLLHKPAPSSRYSTEREWKECGSSKGLAKNSPCPQDLGYKEGLVMSQEHKDHSCKSTCSCEDTENPVHSRSLNETFTIKEFSVDEDDVLGVVMNFPEISASLVQVGSPNRSSPSKTEAWCQSEAAEDYPGQRNTRILGFSKTSPVELLSRTESRCGKSEFPSSVSCNIHDVSLVQSDSVGHCRAPLTLDAEVGLKYDKKTAKNDDAQVKDIQLHSLSSSTVNSFNSKNLDMSCADVTFDSDCSNDSSHERFRNFIDTVSQDTPLAQPYRVWDQTNRQHRMQADSVSHTQVNIIPQSSLKSKAGWTALFPDGRPDDLNVSSFVQPSHCLKSNSAKNVRSETSKCSWKLNKNAQNVLASVGQKVFSISSSLAGDEGHDQDARGGGHHRTAVVTIGNMILSDSSSKLKAPRRRNLFGICKKTKGSKRIQVDAFAKKNGTTTCGITPSHQDGVTSDGTLLLPQDPYLRRTKRRTKSRVCQDLSSCRIIIPEKNKRRCSARNKSKEVLNPLLKQAVRQFLPKIRSPQGMLAKGKGHESLSPGQFREKEFLPRSSKVTECTQPQDELTSCDNIQISSMLPCNRKKKCKYDVSMLSNWPCGSIVPNFSVSKTEITGPIFSEGETERHISGCNFSVGKAETDISQSVYSSSVQVNPDLGFSNNSNLGEDKLKKVVPNDSLPGLKLGASHLKSSLVGKKRDMGRISLATPALHTLHRDPQVQRASKEEENQHLMFPDDAVDKMCNVRQRHTDKPRSTLEMPDDGDDDVIMLIQ